MNADPQRPPDFDAFWAEVDRDLARYPAAPEVEPLPLRSTDFASVSAVRLTSLGPYRVFAYLSVPHGAGEGPHGGPEAGMGSRPFPGLIETPRYGSVNHVPAYALRQRYVVLTLMHRGQRLADQPFAAAYPGLLTLGIEDPMRYVYRGIVADCLRGAEFLLGHPSVDSQRVGIVGDDLALLTAARRSRLAVARVAGLVLYRLMEACARTEAYPVGEVRDLLRAFPGQHAAIARTLALFDPLHHAPDVAARTLLSVEDPGALGGPEWLEPLRTALGKRVELYRLTHEGRTDHDWLDGWLADQLGAPRAMAG